MSKRKYLGTEIDLLFQQPDGRVPTARIVIWNPNRTTINEVVLGKARSPAYDVTDHVIDVKYFENLVFEEGDEAVATNCTIQFVRDADARPIEITGRTLLDGTPIRIYQGDDRIPQPDWPIVFTGVIRGNPSTAEFSREKNPIQVLQIAAVGRAEAFLNRVVTARSYERGEDVGRAAVETAIEWCDLDRREIHIGSQNYVIGHEQSQLVDIEVLKGIHQVLFTVGKKPRFDAEGFLTAADTDLNKPPIRVHDDYSLVVSIVRQPRMNSINNSVRILGLDGELTEVTEREKRIAHGSITAGFFEDNVDQQVWFSETEGKDSGGRRAKDTRLVAIVSSIGDFFGEGLVWEPEIEDDEYTCFGGKIKFGTGYAPEIRYTIMGIWAAAHIVMMQAQAEANVSAAVMDVSGVEIANAVSEAARIVADAAMVGLLLSMTELGRVEWEIYGRPFQNVFQQLCATAQLDGVLTADLKEIEFRNDWLYDIDYMRTRARQLLDREIVKGWTYQIVMIDDPIIEVDDVIELSGRRWYVTSIRKTISRTDAPVGTMTLTAWRLS